MIFVSRLSPRKSGPGVSAIMVSDQSSWELKSFAASVGLSWLFFRAAPRRAPWFEISPSWRRRAVAAGARAVGPVDLAAAIRRYHAAQRAAVAGPV